ncbi:MAG: hypothetical protein AAGF89_04310 [Bacteroidota bacterium]
MSIRQRLVSASLLLLFYFLLSPANGVAQSSPPAFAFDDPPGWERYLTKQLYMLTHSSEAGLILLWPNQAYTSTVAIRQELQQPYREATTLLTPSGQPEELGNNALGTYVSGQLIDQPCRGYLLGFHLPGGTGGNLLVSVAPEYFSAQRARQLAITILRTIRAYESPTKSAALRDNGANTLGSTGGAAELLAGYRIASISSSSSYDSGYRSREIIHFCPSGLVRVETESSFYISGGYGSAAQSDHDSVAGYWKLDGSGDNYVLTLQVNGQSAQESLRVIRDGAGELHFKLKDQVYGYYGAADCR